MNNQDKIKQYEPFWGAWYIDSFIGEGGFGSVYKIKREEFNEMHYCALKHIQIPQSEDELRRFADESADENTLKEYFRSVVEDIYSEIRLMTKLKGTSHIVSYEDHQIIPHDNQIRYDIFIRMEYLTELNKFFVANNISKADIIKLGIDICAGLELCQKYNITHRDIKPDNIYVSPSGDFKLGDFGISKQREKTMAGSRIGTPDYMAPEVYKGDKYNSAVDIYSVGLVMYRYLNNNRMPFMPPYPEKFTSKDRENAFSLRIAGKPFPPPQSSKKDRLSEIVLKACSYNMRDRYSSPTLMRMELEKIKYTKEEKAIIYPAGDVIKLDSKQSEQSADKVVEIKENRTETVKLLDGNLPELLPSGSIEIKEEHTPKKLSYAKIAGIACSFALIFLAVLIIFLSNKSKNYTDILNVGNGLTIEDTTTMESITKDPVNYVRRGNTIGNIINGDEDTTTMESITKDPVNYVRRGNNIGNIINGGYVAQQGEWIYYSNSNDENKLYKILTNGSGKTKLNDDKSEWINVIDDWVYYRNDSDKGKIYKIQTNGKYREQINDDNSYYISVIDDWIFYQSDNDGEKLYKIRTNGIDKEKLNDDRSSFIHVVNDWIYYCAASSDFKLYRIRTDGSEKEKLSDDIVYFVHVFEDWIYYCKGNDDYKLYRVRTNGRNKEKLNDDVCLNINVVEEWVYYSNYNDNNKLYRIRTNGSEKEKLNDDVCLNINVVEEWVYYYNKNDHNKLYRIHIDGTQRQIVD